ncbi:MAG: pyridoxal phosphate-dependent aminotransferase [Treponemataceae bacterium]|nr:pyridoxal phosphate-dependent aminotransferase [Treponemataceae bacterium]
MPIAASVKEIMNNKGSSVIRKMFEEGIALKAKYGEDNVFDFSLGNPDMAPPKEVYQAVQEVAKDENPSRHGYMPNAGYMETREAMAAKINKEQNLQGEGKLCGKNIVMTVGAAGGLTCICKAIISPGDELIVPTPFFAEYRHYCGHFGGKLVPVKSKKDFSIDVEGIKKALSEKTAAVLINSPNNPSGKIYSEEEIRELAKVLKEHGEKCGRKPYLICDEPYRAITYDGKKVASAFPLYNESMVVTSFAKNLSLPGERIGFVAVNPKAEDADELVAAIIFANRTLGYVNSPAFFQKVVAKCWDAKVDYSTYQNRCKMITKVVANAGIEFVQPEGAFYLFCKAPLPQKEENKKYILKNDDGEYCDEFAFCDHMKKYNVLCAPGSGFGCPGYYRMAFCVSEKTISGCEESLKKAKETW